MEYPQLLLSLVGMLAVVLLVMVGAYAFTRWAGKNLGGGLSVFRGGSRIRVLDRAILGRDQGVYLVQAGRRYLLLGGSSTGLTLLAELTEEEGENWNPPPAPDGPEQRKTPDFPDLLRRLKEKKGTAGP